MSRATSGMLRLVEPEILDALSETDPRAVASRNDLRRLNRLMLQDRIMAAMLSAHLPSPPRRILEIGSGDGSFMLTVARQLAKRWSPVDLILLDRQSLVTPGRIAEFAAIGWTISVVEADIFEWAANAKGERFDAIATNLFLHHFKNPELASMLGTLAFMAPVFVATEPRRTRFPLMASRMLGVIGANDVTRHDAPASVLAGFTGHELSELWPQNMGTVTEERRRGLFTHAFAAVATGRPA